MTPLKVLRVLSFARHEANEYAGMRVTETGVKKAKYATATQNRRIKGHNMLDRLILREYQTTTDLLREVYEYMLRLPAVPTTVDLARRVRAHLDNPSHSVASMEAENDLRTGAVRHGGNYSPAGIPVIELEVDGNMVTVFTGTTFQMRSDLETQHGQIVLNRLRRGETVRLETGGLPRTKQEPPQ